MPRKKYSKKQCKKLSDKKCYFCDENRYESLEVHRIFEGNQGGTYHDRNTITVCANHHNLIHAGKIKTIRKYFSTSGKWLLHYIDENGKEQMQ